MTKCRVIFWLFPALLLFAPQAEAEDKEPSMVFEMGGAGDWGLQRGTSSFGPKWALEYTVIEHWLEIEARDQPPNSAKGQAGI